MEHDNSYKLLFSHPRMVVDLLQGFVAEEWVEELDFSTLEKVSGSYVSDDLRSREGDVIWRLRWGTSWIYVYLLLEFQSTEDPFMAVRIMTYLGMLYQDIVRIEGLKKGERLPPALPIVLYNGNRRWTAARDISELVQEVPGGLDAYRPSLRYLLLDEGCYSDIELEPLRNLVAALFRLENSRTPEVLAEVIGTLVDWLQSPEQADLRRAFTVWIQRVLLPGRMPGVSLDEVKDLQEVRTMLAERVVEWTREWENKGIEKGIEKGIKKGVKLGETAFLIRLLESKYGPLDKVTKARIEKADVDQLLRWGEKVLTAENREDVFDNG